MKEIKPYDKTSIYFIQTPSFKSRSLTDSETFGGGGDNDDNDGRPSTLSEKMKYLLAEEGQSTTTHAIPNILRSDDISVRVLWTLFFVISFVYCLYTILQSYFIYLKYGTFVIMNINRVSLADFPAVTICNANPFNNKESTNEYLDSLLMGNLSAANHVSPKFSRYRAKIKAKANVGKGSYGLNKNPKLTTATTTPASVPKRSSDDVQASVDLLEEDLILFLDYSRSKRIRVDERAIDDPEAESSGMAEDTTEQPSVAIDTTFDDDTTVTNEIETTVVKNPQTSDSPTTVHETETTNSVTVTSTTTTTKVTTEIEEETTTQEEITTTLSLEELAARSMAFLKRYYGTKNVATVLTLLMDDLRREVVAQIISEISSDMDVGKISISHSNLQDNLGFSLDEMLLSCSYNGVECTKENFTRFWHSRFGNCFTFNGNVLNDNPLKTSQAGSSYGLHMELFVGDPRVPARFSMSHGIVLSVHNYSTNPTLVDDGLFLATGLQTFAAVARKFTAILPSPYSDCISSPTPFSTYSQKLFGYMSTLNLTEYTQAFCLKLCFQDKLIERCDCADTSLPRVKSSQFCKKKDQLKCLKKVFTEFSTTDANVFCESSCPVECDRITYALTTYNSNYPTDFYIHMLRSKFPTMPKDKVDEYLRKSLLKVIVNYDDLTYRTDNETPKLTVEDILGNVGGQLGLFIGVSILSMIEIVEILLKLSVVVFKHIRETRFSRKIKPVAMRTSICQYTSEISIHFDYDDDTVIDLDSINVRHADAFNSTLIVDGNSKTANTPVNPSVKRRYDYIRNAKWSGLENEEIIDIDDIKVKHENTMGSVATVLAFRRSSNLDYKSKYGYISNATSDELTDMDIETIKLEQKSRKLKVSGNTTRSGRLIVNTENGVVSKLIKVDNNEFLNIEHLQLEEDTILPVMPKAFQNEMAINRSSNSTQVSFKFDDIDELHRQTEAKVAKPTSATSSLKSKYNYIRSSVLNENDDIEHVQIPDSTTSTRVVSSSVKQLEHKLEIPKPVSATSSIKSKYDYIRSSVSMYSDEIVDIDHIKLENPNAVKANAAKAADIPASKVVQQQKTEEIENTVSAISSIKSKYDHIRADSSDSIDVEHIKLENPQASNSVTASAAHTLLKPIDRLLMLKDKSRKPIDLNYKSKYNYIRTSSKAEHDNDNNRTSTKNSTKHSSQWSKSKVKPNYDYSFS